MTFDNLRDDGWKEDELKLFYESYVDIEVTELYLFANSLNMSRDIACQIILSIALSTTPLTLARIIRLGLPVFLVQYCMQRGCIVDS